MERIALVGHSYIARLEDDIKRGHLDFGINLNLPEDYLVGYFGFRGATSSSLVDSPQMQVCKEWKPHKVFLQVGGNVISPVMSAVDVVQGIRGVADRFLDFESVESVIIGSLFHRTRPRGMTAEDYNVQVDRVNKFLKKFYQQDTRVHFWTIRGLVKPSWNIWTSDGTHLNNSATMKYAQQIRMAVRCNKYR